MLIRALHLLPPETAHRLALFALRRGLVPHRKVKKKPRLATTVFGLRFENPLGLAAGFDKNGEAIRGCLGLRFGFVEIGTVTPRRQAGNPKPRLFRLRKDQALINRMGFNNDGLDAVRARLAARDPSWGLVGANIGAKNRVATNLESNLARAVKTHCSDAILRVALGLQVTVLRQNTQWSRK